MTMTFNLSKFDVAKFDSILARGLSRGIGEKGGQACIEAAVCETLGLERGDNPKCVADSVRKFKMALNDACWSSASARAAGLRSLGLAQLGSLGAVNDAEFTQRLREKTIRVLIPRLFREVFPNDKDCLDAALKCEQDGTADAACAAYAAGCDATPTAINGAIYIAYVAGYATYAAAYVVDGAHVDDTYLLLSAALALEVLRELSSPGVALLETA
jgi:hypothetical protein